MPTLPTKVLSRRLHCRDVGATESYNTSQKTVVATIAVRFQSVYRPPKEKTIICSCSTLDAVIRISRVLHMIRLWAFFSPYSVV